MNKRLKAISCALVAIFALSIAVDSPKIGPFGVDAVRAKGEAKKSQQQQLVTKLM